LLKADLVYDAKPITTDGAHAIFVGTNADGQKVIVKDNAEVLDSSKSSFDRHVLAPLRQSITDRVLPNDGRFQNVSDIVMRQVIHDHVDCPAPEAREAAFKDPTSGDIRFGLETPFIEHFGSIDSPGAPAISNPAQAARGVVFSSLLMGNWDSTWHEGNNAEITADGKLSDGTALHTGEYFVSDLGWAGQPGNHIGKIPLGSLALLHSLPAKDVDSAVAEVTHLSNQQLHDWIDEAGLKTVTGWNPELSVV
jgi:hypothetical protein